jgi:hypothetical protein
MQVDKEKFLRVKFISFLQRLPTETERRWGKMNVHQMIEHFAAAVMVASGKLKFPVMTPAEHLSRFREFLMSDKPFKENIKNPVLGDDPYPPKKNTKEAAIGKLQEELISFFEIFKINPGMKTSNPVFGELNYEENIQLLYKHALHHLRQFGVEVY